MTYTGVSTYHEQLIGGTMGIGDCIHLPILLLCLLCNLKANSNCHAFSIAMLFPPSPLIVKSIPGLKDG